MIDKEQYNEWRNHPATLFFRKFLKDRREAMIHAATEAWLNNATAFEAESREARGRIRELFEVEDVPYEAIAIFYKEQEENAAEASETVPR
jgi:hypothetical protein